MNNTPNENVIVDEPVFDSTAMNVGSLVIVKEKQSSGPEVTRKGIVIEYSRIHMKIAYLPHSHRGDASVDDLEEYTIKPDRVVAGQIKVTVVGY